MKIIYTSDIHTSNNLLSDLLRICEKQAADAVVIGGDLIPYHIAKKDVLGELEAQILYLENTFIHESPMVSGSIQTWIGHATSINPGQHPGPDAALRYVLLELSDGPGSPAVQILSQPHP